MLKLPMPDPIIGPEGRLPASYANFYIGNGVVVVPTFGQPEERPDRPCGDPVLFSVPPVSWASIPRPCSMVFGTLHCCSQQQPVTP